MSVGNPFSKLAGWWKHSLLNKVIAALVILIGVAAAVAGLYGISWRQASKEAAEAVKEKAAAQQSKRKFRILVPLYASSQEYLDYMGLKSGARFQKKDIGRKVSIDTVNAIEMAEKAWFKFNESKVLENPKFQEDRVDFYFYPEGTDADSYQRAFNKAMDEAHKEEGVEVVGVLGNITSSATQACGKLYGEQKLPMIIALATATSLTHNLLTNDVPAVLRLPPANDQQAELISDFLLYRNATKVTIVKDLSNPAYSNDLIESFRNHFVSEPLRNSKSAFELYTARDGQILAVVPAGGESGEPFLHTAISPLKSDALLLFGMTEVGLETISQARAANFSAKYVILSDGAIDEHLLPRANNIITGQKGGRIPEGNTIYITFPLKDPLPAELKGVIAENPAIDANSLAMTHAQYVFDAVQIFLTVLYHEIVKKQDASPAKDVIANMIKSWEEENRRQIDGIIFTYDTERKYSIDSFGNSTNMKYHLFRATLPGPITQQNFDPAKIQWVHDVENCKWERPAVPPSGYTQTRRKTRGK